MGPDGSLDLGAAERGPVPGPQVSARAFGAPFAPEHIFDALSGVSVTYRGRFSSSAGVARRSGWAGLARLHL